VRYCFFRASYLCSAERALLIPTVSIFRVSFLSVSKKELEIYDFFSNELKRKIEDIKKIKIQRRIKKGYTLKIQPFDSGY